MSSGKTKHDVIFMQLISQDQSAESHVRRLSPALANLTHYEIGRLAKYAGVPGRMAVRAARGLTVSTASYLLLSSVTGIDPATAAPRLAMSRCGFSVCWKSFASALWFERRRRNLSIRDCSLLLGASIATISRAERAHHLGVESFVPLTTFIGLHPFAFLCFTGNTDCNTKEDLEFVQKALAASLWNGAHGQERGGSSFDVG